MQTKGVGDYVYRVEQPSIVLGQTGKTNVVNVSTISPYFNQCCLQADVLILHLLTEPDVLPIVEERNKRGLPTVYEISDNFLAMGNSIGSHEWYSNPVNSVAAMQFIQKCGYAQTTGRGIQERFGFILKNIRIFENQIMNLGMPKEKFNDEIAIGWGGSFGHIEDLRYFAPALFAVCNKYAHVRFVFMGSRKQYEDVFAPLDDLKKEFHEPGTLSAYLQFLEGVDIGIAPLLPNSYNECRSDVKFVEYGSRAVAPVLSKSAPYLSHAKEMENALFFETPEELQHILSQLIENSSLRKELAMNAYNYVLKERMEINHVQERLNFYTSLCKMPQMNSLDGVPLVEIRAGANAYDVQKTRVEELLHLGVCEESNGNLEKGRQYYKQATQIMPDYYLLWFWIGYSLYRQHNLQSVEFLEKAVQKNPQSLRSWMLWGKAMESTNTEKALKIYERALEISDCFAPALESMAKIAETRGTLGKALQMYDNALIANPFYSPAALGMARIYKQLDKKKDALFAYRVAADLAPNHLDTNIESSEFMLQCNNLAEAAKYALAAAELDQKNEKTQALLHKILDDTKNL